METRDPNTKLSKAFEQLLSSLREAIAESHEKAAAAYRVGKTAEAKKASERAAHLELILAEAEALVQKSGARDVQASKDRRLEGKIPVAMAYNGAQAKGVYDGWSRLTVLAGSTVRARDLHSLEEKIRRLRERCREERTLVAMDRPELLRLTRDLTFDSPSAAAQFVGGCSLNGRELWRGPDGRPIGQA